MKKKDGKNAKISVDDSSFAFSISAELIDGFPPLILHFQQYILNKSSFHNGRDLPEKKQFPQ